MAINVLVDTGLFCVGQDCAGGIFDVGLLRVLWPSIFVLIHNGFKKCVK